MDRKRKEFGLSEILIEFLEFLGKLYGKVRFTYLDVFTYFALFIKIKLLII